MINPRHELPITRQTRILNIARSTVYYLPVGPSARELAIMQALDRLHLEYPFAGSRMLRNMLRRSGFDGLGRRRVARLMDKVGITSIYRKLNTSKPHPGHKVYPYLLRNLPIERPNRVWAIDITYLPMKRGFLYLVAIMDWASRRILSWRLSNTMHADFCITALQEAITKYGAPAIMNSDQDSQFTSLEFTETLKAHSITISMDGKGCWRDNVFIERFWKSIKYEEVYLKAYECTLQARESIAQYMAFYNGHRPHRSLAGQTPDSIYFGSTPAAIAA
jgi:putative transposase